MPSYASPTWFVPLLLCPTMQPPAQRQRPGHRSGRRRQAAADHPPAPLLRSPADGGGFGGASRCRHLRGHQKRWRAGGERAVPLHSPTAEPRCTRAQCHEQDGGLLPCLLWLCSACFGDPQAHGAARGGGGRPLQTAGKPAELTLLLRHISSGLDCGAGHCGCAG